MTTITRERQRVRGIEQRVKRAAILSEPEGIDTAREANVEPPINPSRLGPVHATEAYAAARREREEARARQKRVAAAKAAAAQRVTVIHHEPELAELDPTRASTLVGLDGRPLDAEQLVGPDGKPLQTGQSSIELPRDDAELLFDPLDDDLFDDDALEMDEQQRRESYGRYPRRRLEMAHIIREFGQEYLAQARRDGVSPELLARQERVLRELMGCRTSAMGEHAWSCGNCGEQYVLFNSCGNRHCGKCREHHRRQWAEKLELDLLPVEYHHLVLTLPRELTLLVMAHGDVLYAKVMRAAGMAILAVGKDMLDAQLAVQALLHTWGQISNRHVHIHCLVPAGGLTYGKKGDKKGDKREWVEFPEKGKFLSLEKLSDAFRDLFLEELEKVHASGDLQLTGRWREFDSHNAFKASLDPQRSIRWIVRHRAVWIPLGLERGRPYNSVVRYLARYANRVVIGNSRLEEIDGGDVLFRYKDYRDENRWKTKAMPGVEFLERFLHHMLPPKLHNKRRYGFWGYRVRTKNLALIRAQLGVPPVVAEANATDEEEQQEGEKSRHCAVCKGELEHIGGTHRPTVPVILDMIWADMQRALDVLPESYRVRTYEDLYLEELNTLLAQRMEAQRRPGEKQPSKQNQRRGPPPDQQGRLEFASL